MRILHVTAGNLYGGIERMLQTIVTAQQPDCAHDVAVSFDGRLARELREAGALAHVLGAVRFRRPDTVWRARRALARLLATARYDAVIAHAPWSSALAGPAARRAGRPFLMWAHDAPERTAWPERRTARRAPDRIVCNSRHTAAAVASWLPAVPRDVVHPPVLATPGLPAGDRRALRATLGASDRTTVVLLASRLEVWKGQRVLLDAVPHLRGDVAVWIAGGPQRETEGAYFQELTRLAAESERAGRVHLLGDRTDVPRLMAAADVYCQPNLTPEPFGISFVEALSAGVPVVTTAMGGALEIVDESCGRLVGEASPLSIAAALQPLIDAPELRAALAAAAPARARRVSDPQGRLRELSDLVRGEIARAAAA